MDYENPWPYVVAGGSEREIGHISKTQEQFEAHGRIIFGVKTQGIVPVERPSQQREIWSNLSYILIISDLMMLVAFVLRWSIPEYLASSYQTQGSKSISSGYSKVLILILFLMGQMSNFSSSPMIFSLNSQVSSILQNLKD